MSQTLLFAGIYFSKWKARHAAIVPQGTLLFANEWHAFQWAVQNPHKDRVRRVPVLVTVVLPYNARQLGVGGDAALRGQRWNRPAGIISRRLITPEDVLVHKTEVQMTGSFIGVDTGEGTYRAIRLRSVVDGREMTASVSMAEAGAFRVGALVGQNGTQWMVIDEGAGVRSMGMGCRVARSPFDDLDDLRNFKKALKKETWHARGLRNERRAGRERQREEGAGHQGHLRTVRPRGSFFRTR